MLLRVLGGVGTAVGSRPLTLAAVGRVERRGLGSLFPSSQLLWDLEGSPQHVTSPLQSKVTA